VGGARKVVVWPWEGGLSWETVCDSDDFCPSLCPDHCWSQANPQVVLLSVPSPKAVWTRT
jgi:hypothetical protein